MTFANKVTFPALINSLAAAFCCFFSFNHSSLPISILTVLSLIVLTAGPLISSLRASKSSSRNADSESASDEYEGPSDMTAAVFLVVSALSLALLVAFPVRWPSAVAFGLSMTTLSLSVARKTPLRDAFVVLIATFCLWPVAIQVVERVEAKSEIYMSRLVGDRLDMREILNYPAGRVVQTIKGETTIGQSQDGLTGLRLGAMVACLTGILMRRGPIHVLMLSVSGIFWALVLNGFWVYGRVLMQNEVSGWETVWGSSIFAFLTGFVLIFSTDQLLLVFGLLNPLSWIKRDKPRGNSAQEQEEVDPGEGLVDQEEPVPVSLPPAFFYGVGVVSVVVAVLVAGQSIQRLRANKEVRTKWQLVAARNDSSVWPDKLGRWTRVNTPVTAGSLDKTINGSVVSSISASYMAEQRLAKVSWVGPYTGWHDRFLDFQSSGWSIAREVVSTNPSGKPYVQMNLGQSTGEKGFLIYTMDKIGGETESPSVRNISRLVWWHFLQALALRGPVRADRYMTEVFYESYTGLKEGDDAILGELTKAALEARLNPGLVIGD